MRFSIRDLFLVTVIVALGLGWLVDHWRAAARESAWKAGFHKALHTMSNYTRETLTIESPDGPWRINDDCTSVVPPPE